MAKYVFNWRTTLAGVCSVVMGCIQLMAKDQSGAASVAAGLGLIFSADS